MSNLGKALESMHDVIVFDARDWSLDRHDAWLYAILVGWEQEDTDDPTDIREPGVLEQVAARHGWSAATIARIRRMRAAVKAATADTAIFERDKENGG